MVFSKQLLDRVGVDVTEDIWCVENQELEENVEIRRSMLKQNLRMALSLCPQTQSFGEKSGCEYCVRLTGLRNEALCDLYAMHLCLDRQG